MASGGSRGPGRRRMAWKAQLTCEAWGIKTTYANRWKAQCPPPPFGKRIRPNPRPGFKVDHPIPRHLSKATTASCRCDLGVLRKRQNLAGPKMKCDYWGEPQF